MIIRKNISFILLIISIPVFFLLNIRMGSVDLGWSDVFNGLFSFSNDDISSVIILQYRFPQAITAIAVGIALSLSGLLLQTTFNNPLAGPSVLGISAGASLGVALLILLGWTSGITGSSLFVGDAGIIIGAFGGALSVLLIIVFVSGKIGNSVTVLIIGIMIGYLVSAVVGTLQFFSSSQDLHSFVIWGLGSFSKTSIEQSLYILLLSLALFFVTLLFIKPLNALLLGYRYAISSGYNVKFIQTILILVSGLLIALATAYTGPIAFLGLAVPHIARTIFRSSNHSTLLPAVILIGASLSLICNLISKLPGFDSSLPINAVTSIIGAPIVIWVIVKGRRLNAV